MRRCRCAVVVAQLLLRRLQQALVLAKLPNSQWFWCDECARVLHVAAAVCARVCVAAQLTNGGGGIEMRGSAGGAAATSY